MFSYAINTVRALSADKKGAALVEYGLLVALIAVFCIGAVTGVGNAVSTKFVAISTAL
jgi:pilus assembly protein Flp/PilA